MDLSRYWPLSSGSGPSEPEKALSLDENAECRRKYHKDIYSYGRSASPVSTEWEVEADDKEVSRPTTPASTTSGSDARSLEKLGERQCLSSVEPEALDFLRNAVDTGEIADDEGDGGPFFPRQSELHRGARPPRRPCRILQSEILPPADTAGMQSSACLGKGQSRLLCVRGKSFCLTDFINLDWCQYMYSS